LTFESLLAELERRCIRPVVRDAGVKLVGPRVKLTPELVEQARVHKAALIAYVRASQAQDLVNRLKGYTVSAGQIPAVRVVAVRMRGLTDPGKILSALQNFERELIALGGEYNCQLAETVALVELSFPGARLVT
jgi:hypothetical protein